MMSSGQGLRLQIVVSIVRVSPDFMSNDLF